VNEVELADAQIPRPTDDAVEVGMSRVRTPSQAIGDPYVRAFI
jgi:hypothetical protein